MDARRRTTPHPRVRVAAIAGLMLAASAVTVRAQYVYDDELLPPRVVAWRLSERGFSGLSRPRFDGRAYVVEAFAPNGARVRLFVDAREGDIVGRQRLDAPLYVPPVRIGRPAAPGYGWTEEDAQAPPPVRQAERPVPPADVPFPGPFPGGRPVSPGPAARLAPAYPEPAQRRAEPPARPEAGAGNPLGVNPDARPRTEPARKSARLVPPAKPATPRLAPDAPAPRLAPSEPAAVATRQEPDAGEPAVSKAESARLGSAKPATASAEPMKAETVPTPASVQPPPAEAPDAKTSDAKTSDMKTAESAKGAASWKDPLPEKRPVRVIGGATIVPGADGRADATRTE